MSTKASQDARDRIILHVDMDQFFAAIEEREHPEFKGKPLVVGAAPKEGKGRGVVSTCNYVARKFGVHSGMPISQAWKLCPDATYVLPNFKLYVQVSSRIMRILRKHTDKFQQWGLDEAFLDVTQKVHTYNEAKVLAKKIKQEILSGEKITCSVGIGPNKLVAKIASDFKKPDGLTVVRNDIVKEFLTPLSVRKLLWIGRKTERKLNEWGITTIGELAETDVSRLINRFGTMGLKLHFAAQGIDRSEVAERREIKSVSRETTFETDTNDLRLISQTLINLGEKVHREISKRKMLFRTVTIKIRYKNFETHTHGKTLAASTNRLRDLQKSAEELIREHLHENRMVRLVGLKISSLTSIDGASTLQTFLQKFGE